MNSYKNYEAWQVRVGDFYRCASARERLLFLVRFAVLAPSSHNSQPWHFVVRDSEILLRPDFSRSLAVSDPHNRHLYIALGCALTNLLIAADYYGLEPHVEYFPHDMTVARISLRNLGKPSKKGDDHLVFSIPKRQMNRDPYEARMPEPAFLKMVGDLSSHAVHFELISDRARINTIADIVLEFRVKAFDDVPFRTELSSYKRTNFTRSSSGMPGFTMGFGALFSIIAPRLIRYMNVMHLIKKADEETLKRHTPLLIVVSTRENGKADWVHVGEKIQRMLVEGERLGVSLAISALPHGSEKFREVLGSPLHPHVFFRAGYADRRSGHSPRYSAEEVTTMSK